MKLSEVIEKEGEPGTYAAVRFDKRTINALKKFAEKVGVAGDYDNWHATLLYSRKHLPNYQPIEKYTKPFIGTPIGLDLFGPEKNALVVKFSCPQLYQRHHKLMQQHGATYDFDLYEPHVTLSYDAKDIDLESLPEFKSKIKIIGEYSEDLDAS